MTSRGARPGYASPSANAFSRTTSVTNSRSIGHHGGNLTPSGRASNPYHGLSSLSTSSLSIGTSAAAGTPGSTRSSVALGDLEESISSVLGVRMHSLTDLRLRIEQLSELHRREELAFRSQMGVVLEQSEQARVQQERSIEDYEKLLAKERSERQRMMAMMAAFKSEGSLMLQTLKEIPRRCHTQV